MNRIRSCLLTRFVHSDRLSAPARDRFCLYCIISGKKLPPQKSHFWGAIPKKFLGFGAFPSKNPPPKSPKLGGFWGLFPPKQAAAALPVPVSPSGCNVRKGIMKNGTKDIFKACGARPRSGSCGLRRQRPGRKRPQEGPLNGTFPRRSFHRKQAKMKGLLQNSPNEKNEIDFPQEGLSISFFVVS